MEFYGILNAILKEWYHELKEIGETHQTVRNQAFLKSSKILYYEIIKDEDLLSQKLIIMNNRCNSNMDIQQFIALTKKIKCFTISTKLRSFQYKLLMSAVITNIQLKWYKI